MLAPKSAHIRDQQSKAPGRGKRRKRTIVCMTVCLLLALWGRSASAQNKDSTSDVSNLAHNIKTVFVIVMENHNWTGDKLQSIKGYELAPYINDTLLPMSSYATQYFNPPQRHPSLPNYLWLEAGTDFGIRDDGNPYVHHQNTHEHLVALLEKKGISWRAYDARTNGKSCPLQYWHTPFVFFEDETDNNDLHSAKCIAHDRPFQELKRDLAADQVARYNFIVPTLCNSMHTGCEKGDNTIAEGDQWLAKNVPDILNSSAYRRDGVLFVVWDEGKGTSDGPVPMLLLSPLAKGNGYSNNIHYTHGSLLRTIQEIFGVTPLLRDAAKQKDLRDLFITFP
jgi:hypothetical protein